MTADRNNIVHADHTESDNNDINVNRGFLYGVIGLAIVLIVILYVVDPFAVVPDKIPVKDDLSEPSADFSELRAREIEELNTYKLLDSATATYRIPIDQAMQLLVEEASEESSRDSLR